MSDHPLFKYLHEIDYLSFYDNEIDYVLPASFYMKKRYVNFLLKE